MAIMNENDTKIRSFWWDFISSGLPKDYDLDIIRKIVLLNLIIVVGSIFLGFLSVVAFIQGDLILCAADSALILFLMWLIYILRRKRNYKFVGNIGTIITGFFYLFLIAHGGIEKTAYLWILTYPLIVLFLLGKRVGTYFSILFLCMAGVVFFLGTKLAFFQKYDITIIIRLVSVYATIYLIAILTELVREKVQNKLKGRTNELIETNLKLISEIDERKRIEKALRNSEEFLDDVIESIQDGISVLDKDLTIRHTNSVMKQWYQRNLPLTGKKCYECYHDQNHPCQVCPTLRCMQSGKTEKEIVPGLSGSPVEWLELFSFPIRDRETGEVAGAVEFVRDITIPKRLELQLARAQKMEAIGTLAGGVAHDLNNILSGLVSYPELLLMDIPADSPIKAPIETIQKSGKKAAAIVQDMLTLARRGVAVNEVVNLNDTVTNFFDSLECSNIKKYHPKVLFDVDLQPDLFNIVGSPVHLSKTVMNLVSNAAEAIIDSGSVHLETKNTYIDKPLDRYEEIPEGEYVVLSVTDSGLGISSEDMDKIFEPFYTKKRMGRSGTGLGMAVVWGTVKDLDGFIDILSTSGTGTKIDLYFPVTRRNVSQKEKAIPIEKYMGSEKVLVVDDVEEQRNIALAMLEKIGYSVTAVSSGEESIKYLAQNHADILILDMVMDPGMDGFETYKEIVKRHPNQKAIIASGYSETDRVREAQRLGAGKYIRKPYTLENLGMSIRIELDKSPAL